MVDIKILDCTLRDGGYKNNWQFKNKEIAHIITSLKNSYAEIIECGYLSEINGNTSDSSIFNSPNTINTLITKYDIQSQDTDFAAMINYGEYKINNIPSQKQNPNLKSIRVAFHKKDKEKALIFAEQIAQKGYILYLQPMVISEYSENEIHELLNKIKKINCKAAYIVDSLGILSESDIIFLQNIFDKNLPSEINIGLHLHNTNGLAFKNALAFINNANKKRNIIIDSSLNGIGRGAGNLKTEEITEYLNTHINKNYNLKIISDISKFYAQKFLAGCI